jgi:hypothetical protein
MLNVIALSVEVPLFSPILIFAGRTEWSESEDWNITKVYFCVMFDSISCEFAKLNHVIQHNNTQHDDT